MTARKMFEASGWNAVRTPKNQKAYSKRFLDNGVEYEADIFFLLKEKKVVALFNNDKEHGSLEINMDCLKLINKQCQELGWSDG